MDPLLLIIAVVLAGIGVDILRFRSQPPATLREEDELIFGQSTSLRHERRRFYVWTGMYGAAVRTPQLRALAVILLIVATALAAKGLGVL